MKKYEVVKTCFINGSRYKPGAIVEFDGKPGKALKPVTEEKVKKQKAQEHKPEPTKADETASNQDVI